MHLLTHRQANGAISYIFKGITKSTLRNYSCIELLHFLLDEQINVLQCSLVWI